MKRSRVPSTSRRLPRQSSRNETGRYSRGHVYTLIAFLFFCLLAISQSKLSSVQAGSLFISSSVFPLRKHANFSERNDVGSGVRAERKLEERAQKKVSLLTRQEGTEDVDNEVGVVGEGGIVDDWKDNGEEQEDQQQQQQQHKESKDGEGAEESGKHQKGDSEGGESWLGVRLNTSMLGADSMSTWVRDSITNKNLLAGSVVGRSQTQHPSLEDNGVKAIPRWDPLETIGNRGTLNTKGRHYPTWRSSRLLTLKWDHLLGVVRRIRSLKSSSMLLSRKIKLAESQFTPSFLEDSGSSFHDLQSFSSDDEPVNQHVRAHLEEVTTIEDALLLRVQKGKSFSLRSWADKKLKGDAYKKEKQSKSAIELLNPMNNPLLQDPDTPNPNGLSANDRAVLKALQTAGDKGFVSELRSVEAEHTNADTNSFVKISHAVFVTDKKPQETSGILKSGGGQLGNAAERSILEFSSTDSSASSGPVIGWEDADISIRKNAVLSSHLSMDKRPESFVDTRRWGFYPGLDSNLAFSDFMEQFLEEEKCSHSVFMVWTTPPWTYTVRYQRGLESIFYFHPRACVVVFSISIELDFFMSFAEEGFRVAVVVPNLEELLAETPADVFASFWLPWKKTHFFHIHFSELLRLAALYKYGGVYLDTDVVLLKPFALQYNTIGAEEVKNGARKLNSAVMAFDKNSSFLLECLLEFTATYDDLLLEFNGADLVTRVANRIDNVQNKSNKKVPGGLRIEVPHAFFPLGRDNIARYFKAPDNKEQKQEVDWLTQSLLNQSSMLHFWNQRTQSLIPEASSLVERILNRHCIRCDEYL